MPKVPHLSRDARQALLNAHVALDSIARPLIPTPPGVRNFAADRRDSCAICGYCFRATPTQPHTCAVGRAMAALHELMPDPIHRREWLAANDADAAALVERLLARWSDS